MIKMAKVMLYVSLIIIKNNNSNSGTNNKKTVGGTPADVRA